MNKIKPKKWKLAQSIIEIRLKISAIWVIFILKHEMWENFLYIFLGFNPLGAKGAEIHRWKIVLWREWTHALWLNDSGENVS